MRKTSSVTSEAAMTNGRAARPFRPGDEGDDPEQESDERLVVGEVRAHRKTGPGDAEGELLDERAEDEPAHEEQARPSRARDGAGFLFLSRAARPAAVEKSMPENMTRIWGIRTQSGTGSL